MESNYYYSQGRKIPVTTLRSARVVRIPENRESVAIPGWTTISLGNKRFVLIVPANLITERTLQIHKLEDLRRELLDIDREMREQLKTDEERALDDENDLHVTPVLVEESGGLLLPTGEVVARFRAGLDLDTIEREVKQRNGILIQPIYFFENTYLLRPVEGGTGLELGNSLVESGLVDFASPNFIEEMPWRKVDIPPNKLFPQQWHLCNNDQFGNLHASVGALDAWRITKGSPNITICILDSGIDSAHEAFSLSGKLVPGFDFEDNDAFPDPTTSSHGTSCAGVAAAPWGCGDVVGIAPGCRLMSIRRASLSEHLKMAEAFVWAASHNADIISCSFGYDHRNWVLPDIVRAAIDKVVDEGRQGKGCVIIWAAGNGNEPISSDEWASYEKVIAVAASTDEDIRAPYSDFGPEVELCAPSSGGRKGIMTTSIGGYTAHFGGTSAAAPLIAGVAALILSLNPNLTCLQVRKILRKSTDRIDVENGSYDVNGHSDLYGYGRVNAYKALQSISVLEEAVRGSDIENCLGIIQQFIANYVLKSSGGHQIIDFLEDRRFLILRLLISRPGFQDMTVSVIRAIISLYESIQRSETITISENTWSTVTAIVKLLLTEEPNERDEGISIREDLNMSESTPMTIDDVLARLADILRQSGQITPPSSSPVPTPIPPDVAVSEPAQLPKDMMQFREMLATELRYMSMVPPLKPDMLLSMDERLTEFLKLLKSLKSNPYLYAQVSRAMSLVQQVERSEDPELEYLANRMARDITGDPNEREVITLAILIATTVGAIVGGISIGRATYEASH